MNKLYHVRFEMFGEDEEDKARDFCDKMNATATRYMRRTGKIASYTPCKSGFAAWYWSK